MSRDDIGNDRRDRFDIMLEIGEAVLEAGRDGISPNELMEKTKTNSKQLKFYLKRLQPLIVVRKTQVEGRSGRWGRPPEKMIYGIPLLVEKLKILRNLKEERDNFFNTSSAGTAPPLDPS